VNAFVAGAGAGEQERDRAGSYRSSARPRPSSRSGHAVERNSA
jgi:hypothetical protein